MARKQTHSFINMHDGTALSVGIVKRVKCVCGQVIYVEAESTRKLCTICNQSTLGKRIRVK